MGVIMGCISVFGIGGAARIAGSAILLLEWFALTGLSNAGLSGSELSDAGLSGSGLSTSAGALDVGFAGLRNSRGMVRICVTSNPAHFPRCDGDPRARQLTVAAGRAGSLHFRDLVPGTYAISAIHDENGNGRLDTFLGIPREGFGFSRNPRIGFGPPRFDQARFQMGPDGGAQTVRFRYIG